MNIYRTIILTVLAVKYAVDLISEWLNIRSLNPEPPGEFKELYDADKYRRSQEYTKARTGFHWVESTFGLLVLLIFWFAGGFNWLDLAIRNWNFGVTVSGLLYIGMLALANYILGLPFGIYSTFVIEERYGFNRTTARTFITDHLKVLVLSILLGVPLLAAILWFFEATGARAWLYCWLVSALFTLAIQYVAPVWIMPLFNKYTPLPEGELKEAIVHYTRNAKFLFKEIFVVDASKRSTKPNAFFTGFGRNKRITLFDTLVSENTTPEVVAVLAHEVGHYKKRHVIKMMVFSFLHMGIVFFLLSLFIRSQGLFEAFYMEKISAYAGLLFFGLLYEPISLALSVGLHVLSRSYELQADRYAVETTGDQDHMISALKRLSVKSLSNLTPHPFYVFLNYSHPPLAERVHKIRNV